MSFNSTEISVPARYSSLSGLIETISRQAGDFGLDAGAILRLQLVLEELFANTINHGHGGESGRTVEVSVRTAGGGLTLCYSDDAPPFDIGKNAPAEPSTASIGGRGLNLIHGMSQAIRYRRENGKNVTEVDFAKS